MNQKVFDTQLKVRELMEEAIAVWQQSNYSTQLLSLKDDPVFKLIMSAMAHQTNEIDNDIERLRIEIINEFSEIFTTYDANHATPASAVVRTEPMPGVSSVEVDSGSVFKLDGTGYDFIPVMHTRVLPAEVTSLDRIDGRRWEVGLTFASPVSDLSLMSFTLRNPGFHDVRIFIGEKELPLVRPWEYSELPFSDAFAFENIRNSGSTVYDPSMSLVDLFARHGLRMYFIRKHRSDEFLQDEVTDLKLTFEFEGSGAAFVLSREDLTLNTVLLANAAVREVTLDSSHPVARLTGNSDGAGSQLMHVLNPGNDQIFGEARLHVRKVAGDRFNKATLIRSLASLIDKYHSDYYAFANLDGTAVEGIVAELEAQLRKLTELARGSWQDNIGGTYLMLDKESGDAQVSVTVRYLTTDGSAASANLTEKGKFLSPGGLNAESTVQIVPPVPGSDEVKDNMDKLTYEQVRRFQHTGFRIVTTNDIRVFCYKELAVRYGIVSNIIRDISVRPHLCEDRTSSGNGCGYEILVTIDIADTAFVRRNFSDRIPQAEILMAKMMQVRSVNIYPISVKINVN